jgi:small subunit ribosomal protein S9
MKENTKKIKEMVVKKGLLSTNTVSRGTGRRKSSVAQVRLSLGAGTININKKDFASYCQTDVMRRNILEPLALLKVGSDFNIDVKVYGGGVHSQAGAIRLGLARALLSYKGEEVRSILRGAGFLTVDARRKERKKYGQKGARKKFQFVKR